MPPKRHRIRGGGSVPAVARRPKPDEPDYDFSQRPTYDGGQISDIPDDIVKEDWTKVLKADTPSDREHYDNILQRLGYYNPALSDEDERHRCSYVWGLWPEFSLRRIWMVAGFAREEDWAKANPNLYKYIYYTLAYQATQVEKVVERSKLSVLMRVIPALQKDVGEFWIYDLGVFGNPWEQVSGRALIDNLGEILALHEVKDFRAAVGYAVLAKLRFGRLKTDPTARSTARSNKEFTPLPVFPLIRCDMSSDDKLKKQLEKVREERYPMPSDIDDVEKWFDLSTEQQEEWKAEWVADLMYEWQGQVELPRPSMLESHKHPSPLPPRPPGRARGSERPQIPPRPVRGSECTRLSKQLADAESELESARRKIRDLEESQKSLPQQHQTERQADAEALLELGKEFETFKSTAANTQAKLEAQLTEVRTSLKKYLRLPLELLSLVGQFALGDDNHATLANFSLTSHLLREELLPIMYETVVLSEKDPRCYAIFWGNTVTRNPFTFTKYLISNRSIKPSLQVFPKLKVLIQSASVTTCPDHDPLLATDSLTIFKSVHSMTVSSLLSTPFPRRTTTGTSRRAVEHISAVTVEESAFVLGDICHEKRTFTSVTDDRKTEFTLRHRAVSEQLGQTVSQLLWLTMSSKRWVEHDESDGDGGLSDPKLTFDFHGTLSDANLVMNALAKLSSKGFAPSVEIKIASKKTLSNEDLEASSSFTLVFGAI